jgi:hypothetical protein
MRPNESGRRDDDVRLDLEPARVVPVGPVVRTRAGSNLLLVVGAALVVGTLAFVAGLQLGGARSSDASRPSASPSEVASIAAVASPSPTAGPVDGPLTASAFADAFQPPQLFAEFVGGKGCVTRFDEAQEAIGVVEYVLSRTWTTFCPLKASGRAALAHSLMRAISNQVPGSGSSGSSADDGSTLVVYSYAQNGYVGTVTLSANSRGSGFEVVILLQERRSP